MVDPIAFPQPNPKRPSVMVWLGFVLVIGAASAFWGYVQQANDIAHSGMPGWAKVLIGNVLVVGSLVAALCLSYKEKKALVVQADEFAQRTDRAKAAAIALLNEQISKLSEQIANLEGERSNPRAAQEHDIETLAGLTRLAAKGQKLINEISSSPVGSHVGPYQEWRDEVQTYFNERMMPKDWLRFDTPRDSSGLPYPASAIEMRVRILNTLAEELARS